MLLIVGLGNIGKEYENTFHNMGFGVIDALAAALKVKVKKAECSALTHTFSRFSEKVVIAMPTTYMNNSGAAVKSLAVKYKADDIIIIYDDIDIPRYSIRARSSGSGGTHNGMRDVVAKMGTTDIKRIRIGIGREDDELRDYVLSKIKKEDAAVFSKVFDRVAEELLSYVKDKDFDKLMRELNT